MLTVVQLLIDEELVAVSSKLISSLDTLISLSAWWVQSEMRFVQVQRQM